MEKMWAGRNSGDTDVLADDLNSSIGFDCKLYEHDIRGSIAHAKMLAKQGIITLSEEEEITEGLAGILDDIKSGALHFDPQAEDIHMFVEQVLTDRIGNAGKKLHTARSRNDQVALDTKLYLRSNIDSIRDMLKSLVKSIVASAENNIGTVMPGYTHLQKAQPILYAHHILAYAMMFLRDSERLLQCRNRMNVSPIGSCALAGTTYNTDREFEASLLDFDSITLNSIDGVSDRDHCVEFLSCASILMMHMSRLSEELVLWSSSEFGYITIDDAYTTGSSIMPQKKNPDMAELIRGKTGRVYGDLIAMLVTLKGLSLAYNKDMQEDKEQYFDAVETVLKCLPVMTAMIETMKVNVTVMEKACEDGFINATDLADYLVGKGLAFRDAYRISGKIVARCIESGCPLVRLPLEEYRKFSDVFDTDLYDVIDIRA
ncbi:MAG: argininosuccinate lyase, partial [Sphaerochaetaceae bacterium]|nr:argininosuccinate lyase [Sphaerochaetaceae bacterium]